MRKGVGGAGRGGAGVSLGVACQLEPMTEIPSTKHRSTPCRERKKS